MIETLMLAFMAVGFAAALTIALTLALIVKGTIG
jgi:hypothetical protein